MSYFSDDIGNTKMLKVFGHAIGGIVVLILLFGSFTVISPGYRGIIVRVGTVSRILDQGIHLKFPMVERVVKVDVRTVKDQIDASAASKDLQDVQTTIALTSHLDALRVGDIYQTVGIGGGVLTNNIIIPAIQESLKAATSQFTAEELVTKREEVKEKVRTALRDRLAKNFVIVEDVSIVNFKFSESFEKAIEAKVTAEQDALAAKNKLEQVKYEAQQQIETAKAQAESIKIQASAVNAQGGADYVKLQAINKWDGVLPTQIVPNGATPFIDITPTR